MRIKAADYDVEIQRITLALVTRIEVEHGDGEQSGGLEFHYQVSHEEALHLDWTAELSGWLDAVADRHAGGFHQGMGGHDPYGHHQPYGHHGHDEHGHRGGPGWGTVAAAGAAGVAAGVVGGMVAGEVMEEVFEGDEEED